MYEWPSSLSSFTLLLSARARWTTWRMILRAQQRCTVAMGANILKILIAWTYKYCLKHWAAYHACRKQVVVGENSQFFNPFLIITTFLKKRRLIHKVLSAKHCLSILLSKLRRSVIAYSCAYCCRSEWAWSERARQLYNRQKTTL